MVRRIVALAALMSVMGCIIPKLPVNDAAEADIGVASLMPGAVYVSTFPLEERSAVCRYLGYLETSSAFETCLQGYFPDNPALAKKMG